MKNIKILFSAFAITFLLSVFGVSAYGTGPVTVENVNVPGFSATKVYVGERTKNTAGDQTITEVNVQRDLDVMLQYWNNVTNDWRRGGVTWYTLAKNKDITFKSEGPTAFYPSVMTGDYRLMVDSRITYFTGTKIHKLVYNPGN